MKPLLLHYYITNRCNAKCSFCTIWAEHPKTDASLQDVQVNLKEGRRAGCRFVDFTGGEPLLHPDLPNMLSAAKKMGYITSVTTNAILFPQCVEQLRKKIDLLHFSLDADTAELHDKIRGVASFDAVLQSIPLALAAGMIPDLLFTYTNENIDTFAGVHALARKHRLIAILDPVFSTRGPDTNSAVTHEKARLFAKLPGVYLNHAHLLLRQEGGNHIRAPHCRSVASTIVITPDNRRALPCFHHRTDLVPLDKATLPAIFASDRHPLVAKAYTKQGRYAFCEGCHINCYFDPSYSFMANRFFFHSLLAKLSYSWTKYLRYRHFGSIPWIRR